MTYILKLRKLDYLHTSGWSTAYFCPGTSKVAGSTTLQDANRACPCSHDPVWHVDAQPLAYRFHSMEQVQANFDVSTLDRLGIIVEQVEA